MHKLYELKDKLLKELEEYSQNSKYSKDDVETIKYMASAVDHLCNIVERAEGEEEEYSQRGGSMRYSREGGGSSYRGGRSERYSRNYGGGSYARGRSSNARRDSMGRYSRTGDTSEMVEQLEDLMQDAPNEQVRNKMQELVQQLEQM